MTEIILKNDIEQSKIDALLSFLKSWNIDAELKMPVLKKTKKKDNFSLAIGMWKDTMIDSKTLREKAWNRL